MRNPSISIFFVMWVVAVAGLVLTVCELIATWQFFPLVFRIGLRLVKRIVPCNQSRASHAFMLSDDSENWKFKALGPDRCLFRASLAPFARRLHTPFALRGTITRRGNVLELDGRLPTGPLIVFGAWLIAWAAGSLFSGSLDSSWLISGWGFALGIVVLSVFIETRRIRTLFNELRAVEWPAA